MLEILLISAILLVDQVTKYCSERLLSPVGTTYPLIPGVFHFTSAHNAGAAWGMLQGGKWFFLVLTVLVCAFLVWLLVGYRRRMSVFSRVLLSLRRGYEVTVHSVSGTWAYVTYNGTSGYCIAKCVKMK